MMKLDNLTNENYKLMDELLKFEYEHKNQSISDEYMFQKLKSNKKDVMFAARNIKRYIDEVSGNFCVVQVYNSNEYSFVSFNHVETEYLIKTGFKKAIKSHFKSSKESWFNKPLIVAIISLILGAILNELSHFYRNNKDKHKDYNTIYIHDTIYIKNPS